VLRRERESMQFIRSEELRPGLRIAKPIYNKDGVLLYERNSRLTIPAINSIRNFDLIGIYILEPAEPVPARQTCSCRPFPGSAEPLPLQHLPGRR